MKFWTILWSSDGVRDNHELTLRFQHQKNVMKKDGIFAAQKVINATHQFHSTLAHLQILDFGEVTFVMSIFFPAKVIRLSW